MKNFIYLIMICSCFINKISKATSIHAQGSIAVVDAVMINGYMANGFGNDATMVSGTPNNIASAAAVRQFVHDSSKNYGPTLTTNGVGAATYTGSVLNIPTFPYLPVISDSTSRTLNSNFTVTATGCNVFFLCYSVKIAVTLALSSLTGMVTVQYSTNGGTSWKSLPTAAFTPPTAGLGILTSQIVQVNGFVPNDALVKITTSTVSGVAYTYMSGQEVNF